MKKRLLSLTFAVLMILSMCGIATADEEIEPYASAYLDACSVQLRAVGNGKMEVDAMVESVGGEADRIGLKEIYIEQQKYGKWYFYASLDSVDHPEFYQYNTWDYVETIPFDGVAGYNFRVTIMAYSERDGGWDTMELTSHTIRCR